MVERKAAATYARVLLTVRSHSGFWRGWFGARSVQGLSRLLD